MLELVDGLSAPSRLRVGVELDGVPLLVVVRLAEVEPVVVARLAQEVVHWLGAPHLRGVREVLEGLPRLVLPGGQVVVGVLQVAPVPELPHGLHDLVLLLHLGRLVGPLRRVLAVRVKLDVPLLLHGQRLPHVNGVLLRLFVVEPIHGLRGPGVLGERVELDLLPQLVGPRLVEVVCVPPGPHVPEGVDRLGAGGVLRVRVEGRPHDFLVFPGGEEVEGVDLLPRVPPVVDALDVVGRQVDLLPLRRLVSTHVLEDGVQVRVGAKAHPRVVLKDALDAVQPELFNLELGQQ
mmetsp:Transcript_77782/g.219971  ORF Transcript_77782/g.219971 Transcript_77782/m.219971 type:complete len:291 (+) Transcript_77782:529-1401(+)